MRILTKIVLIIILVVLGSFLLKQLLTKMVIENDHDHHEYTDLPVGDSNVPRGSVGVIPTTVGVDPEDTQPFTSLLTREPDQQFSSALATVYDDVYGIFPCNVGAEKTNVVMFTAKTSPTPEGPTYEHAKQQIELWEPHLLPDIGYMIFPERSLPETPGLLSFVQVGDSPYRRASAIFNSGEAYVYTGWRLNYVFYASSLECLVGAMDLVYEAH